MAQAETDELLGGSWWVCTGPLWQGGKKIIGPFESTGLAMRVREYVEAVPMAERPDVEARGYATFWIDHEAVAGPGHVENVPVSASEPNPPKAGR